MVLTLKPEIQMYVIAAAFASLALTPHMLFMKSMAVHAFVATMFAMVCSLWQKHVWLHGNLPVRACCKDALYWRWLQ